MNCKTCKAALPNLLLAPAAPEDAAARAHIAGCAACAQQLASLQATLALYPATGFVLHMTDWAKIELLKDTDPGIRSRVLAAISEAGPEAVIPLSAFDGGSSLAGGGSGGSGSGNIVINITGTFLSQDAARQVANLIATSINRQYKLKSFA